MANKVKIHEELPFVFTASGNYTNPNFPSGTTFINWDTVAASTGGVVLSAICDLGPAPRTNLFEWRSRVWAGSGTNSSSGQDMDFYLATSNNVYGDGGYGSGMSAPATFAPQNLQPLGGVRCPISNTSGQASGRVRITERYVFVAGYSSYTDWDSSHYSYFMLTPVPLEVQD